MNRDLGDHGLDMPFEENPQPAPMPPEDVDVSGGVLVAGAVFDVAGVGPKPALLFRFSDPLGRFYKGIVLVLDDSQMEKLGKLVDDAANSALGHARRR